MRIIEGLAALADLELPLPGGGIASRSMVAVGVFDGMHLGHLRLVHDLLEMASELQGGPTVITFATHPAEVIAGRAPEPLISVPHRLLLLRRAGVQRVLLLTFDTVVRAMTAERFAREVLCDGLHTKGLLLGFDSAMGKDREGTPEQFAEIGQDFGFEVRTGRPVEVDGEPVSSTAIRTAITSGDLDQACRLLGRRPAGFGEVVHGDHRGRGLGFPTANIRPQCQALPPQGVYAVEILHKGEQHVGVANLGIRPTFKDEGDAALTLEVHFLREESEEDLDLYGATLEVAFAKRLRGERQFANAEELKAQIAEDIRAARHVLGV